MANRHVSTEIFREKSIERISSPENLNQYIRSTRPSLWLLLGAIIVLLVGILVWSSLGKLESYSVVGCRVKGGVVTSYLKETDYEKITDHSTLTFNGKTYPMGTVSGPSPAGTGSDTFLLQAAGIESGEWYYTVTCPVEEEDGQYKGRAVYDRINPIVFITN